MDDPHIASDPNDIAPVAPTVKLLTRRKVQQQKLDAKAKSASAAAAAAAASAAVKIELSDSPDESDSAVVAPAKPPPSLPSSPPVAAAVASTSGMSTRKAAARSAAVKRPIINVDAWSTDEEDFAGFDKTVESNFVGFGAKNGGGGRNSKLSQRNKRIKEEPVSDDEPVEVKLEVKMENETEEEDDAAANAAAAAVAAPSGRRQPKRVSTPPKASAAAAAVAAAIIEQHMISPPSIAAQMSANLTNVVTAALASTPTTSGGGNKTTTNISDPRYRKPFTFGWKRELVYRAHNDVHRKQYDKAEVYYITPGNKKLRTRADILMNLTEGLDANDFTFAREPIGMSAEEEIIRSAKLQTPSSKHRPVNFLDLGEADPMLGFGKRVPKPKMPKGASPPPQLPPLPASLSVTLLQSPSTSGLLGKQAGSRNMLANKQMAVDMEKAAGKSLKGSKARDEPCTIQCVLAMGTIPQLQCKKCLCLFHPECIVRRAAGAPSPNNYVCESCLHESNTNDTGDAITIASSSAASTSSAMSAAAASMGGGSIVHLAGIGGVGTASLVAAATSLSANAAVGVGSAVASIVAAERNSNNKRHNNGSLIEAATSGAAGESTSKAPSATVASVAAAATTSTPTPADRPTTNGKATAAGTTAAPVAAQSVSVIGAVTPWLPATASLTTNRADLDINSTPPQSIAIVAGRKYIMVPQTHLMSVSPSGDVKIGDNNGIPLQYVDESGGAGSMASPASKRNSSSTPNNAVGSNSNSAAVATAPTTGDDATPPLKKRLLSRRVSNKAKTPSRSPNNSSNAATHHKSSTPAATSATGRTESRHIRRGQQPVETASGNVRRASDTNAGASSSSVHTLFATDFFNNVSTGYNVLMHTFQYLKVQELLRAACVCRMWNQAAQNSRLWRTVRMKNSQVNDWSGLVSTLQRNGTRHLDLRKMPMPAVASGNADAAWEPFSENIGRHAGLEAIDLCRLPARVVERLFESNAALRIVNAVSIKDEQLRLADIGKLQQLQELRLKSLNSMHIDSLQPLQTLTHLRHLSLTSVKEMAGKGVSVLGNLLELETLELGECNELAAGFGTGVLLRLKRLQRLRLERGVDCCTFEILDAVAQMPALTQLELVNFDIKPEFDAHLQRCKNVRRLLVIPTYISQSATTNHMILNALLQLADNLEQLTWVVTLELLRVTELYVDQCDGKRRDRKLSEDKIPVLKPVPGMAETELAGGQKAVSDVPQVEILPLEKVEKILAQHMPSTKFAIIKLPYHATWRQCMTDNM